MVIDAQGHAGSYFVHSPLMSGFGCVLMLRGMHAPHELLQGCDAGQAPSQAAEHSSGLAKKAAALPQGTWERQ